MVFTWNLTRAHASDRKGNWTGNTEGNKQTHVLSQEVEGPACRIFLLSPALLWEPCSLKSLLRCPVGISISSGLKFSSLNLSFSHSLPRPYSASQHIILFRSPFIHHNPAPPNSNCPLYSIKSKSLAWLIKPPYPRGSLPFQLDHPSYICQYSGIINFVTGV